MSHKERTIKWLKKYKSITSMEAFLELGNTRLSATIFDLRQDDWNIASVNTKGKNRFGEPTNFVKYVLRKPYRIGE